MTDSATYGLFLNMGRNLGDTAEDVVRLTLDQATQAEELGFHDLWLTEHHFIPFGINPSALTAAGFLLGRTERLRVGTAVTLSPLHHPIELAERAALLDQLSGGRFDLGLGRGGYLKDFEVLDIDPARWDAEPMHSAESILSAWTDRDLARPEHTTGESVLQPPPLSDPHPPLFMATRSPDAIRFAAEHHLPLQHYFASPVEQRIENEAVWREANPDAAVPHLHTLIVVIDDDETEARRLLTERLTESFRGGDWPHVPQAGGRHPGPDGKPIDRETMARYVAKGSIVGPAEKVAAEIDAFREATGASRLAFFVEAIADPGRVQSTLDGLAELLHLDTTQPTPVPH